MCFVRTESLHFDPVVPSNYPEGININTYSDSDASIVITDELNEDNEQNTWTIPLMAMNGSFSLLNQVGRNFVLGFMIRF